MDWHVVWTICVIDEPTMFSQFKNLPQQLDYFKDEQTCKDYLATQRWNGHVTCPFCSHEKVYTTNRGYKCASKVCNKKFSVTVGTIFENTKLPLRKWYAAIYLASSHKKGISSLQIARDLGIDKKNAWFMLHRIREAFAPKPIETQIDGLFHADEVFIGGKNKNRHADKKVPESQGRSTKDKTPVFGIMQTGGKITTVVVPDTKAKTLKPIIEQLVAKGAIIVTDEWLGYTGLSKNYGHIVIKHKDNEYVRGAFHNNNIEGYWSLFKRMYIGTYHYMSRKHLARYCNELSYRFNSRTSTEADRFASVVQCTNGKRITFKQLTGKQ